MASNAAAAAAQTGRRQGRREDLWAGSVPQIVDQLLRTRGETAQTSDRFAQRPNADGSVFDTELLADAATVLAEYAGPMCFVDNHACVKVFGKIAQFTQRREVSVHAENGVGDDPAKGAP